MLSVYPDLLSDRAPPPLTPDLINTIPVVTLDQAKIGEMCTVSDGNAFVV